MKTLTLFAASTLLLATNTAFAQDRPPLGSCDQYAGPEKQQCLKEGGTVEAGMKSNSADARSSASQGASLESPDVVKQAQEKLNASGYDAGPADGNLGPQTEEAVMAFQSVQGLEASGQLDSQTLAALQVDTSAGSASSGSSTAAGSSPQSTTGASPEQPNTGTGGAPEAGPSPERTAEPKQ